MNETELQSYQPFIILMKKDEKILQLHPHLSKLIDSLCFELAVNIPDQNSLSLLEIIAMRQQKQITFEQFVQLYKEWLQSKKVFDIFSAKQIKIFSKGQLIVKQQVASHLHINSINNSLELLNDIYDHLFEQKQIGVFDSQILKQVQQLFSFLDAEGNIHLRLSQLFFLNSAMLIQQNISIPQHYDTFKSLFKLRNRQLCQCEGIVCLRSFKNYFLFHSERQILAKRVLQIIKDIQREIRGNKKDKKIEQNGLPNIIEQAFARWRNSSRFSGLFQTKKKKIDIYHRIFQQNQSIFFFNGGKDDFILTQNYFIKKYGEQYVKLLAIDSHLLQQFAEIVKQILNQYLQIINKLGLHINNRHNRLEHQQFSVMHTPIQQLSNLPHYNDSHMPFSSHNKTNNHQILNKKHHFQKRSPLKIVTPNKNKKQNQTRKNVLTPVNKNTRTSSFAHKMFGSSQKSLSKNKKQYTPSKQFSGAFSSSLYVQNNTLSYKCSQKEGLQKDSFYQKLFFFRNKRVQSFDIVMKRLKGK